MTDRRRRQKELRTARREAEKKSKARRELGRRLGFGLGFGVLIIALFVLGSLGDREGSLPGSYQGYRNQPTACDSDAPPAESRQSFSEPTPQSDITASSHVLAKIDTSCGEIVIDLDTARSPQTVNSFVFLAREGFYDGTVFHRINSGFVIQGGDPDASGTGGPGYRIPDEHPEAGFDFAPGVVAMANAGRGTTGSQFFFVVGETAAALNPTFNILGSVVSGTDTLQRIEQVPTARRPASVERSLPLESVYINSITIEVTGS